MTNSLSPSYANLWSLRAPVVQWWGRPHRAARVMPLQVAGSIPAGCMEGDVEHDGIQDDEVPISEALSVRFLQKQVRGSCEKHFGSTKLPERLRDLQNEVAEIVHYRDRANLEEEVGDAGWSLL